MNWVKLKKYCELKGETTDAVHGKRKTGLWIDGLQCKIAEDGNLWVDLDMVDEWVELGTTELLKKYRSRVESQSARARPARPSR